MLQLRVWVGSFSLCQRAVLNVFCRAERGVIELLEDEEEEGKKNTSRRMFIFIRTPRANLALRGIVKLFFLSVSLPPSRSPPRER